MHVTTREGTTIRQTRLLYFQYSGKIKIKIKMVNQVHDNRILCFDIKSFANLAVPNYYRAPCSLSLSRRHQSKHETGDGALVYSVALPPLNPLPSVVAFSRWNWSSPSVVNLPTATVQTV